MLEINVNAYRRMKNKIRLELKKMKRRPEKSEGKLRIRRFTKPVEKLSRRRKFEKSKYIRDPRKTLQNGKKRLRKNRM